MDRHREVDEEEIQRLQKKEQEVPRDWRPSRETIRAIQGEKDTAEQTSDQQDKPARADRMIERMMEKEGKADLTKPGAWGRFTHAAIQDAIQEVEPSAEVEKQIGVVKDDGTIRKGRIDVVSKDGILEIKT